MPPRKQRNRDQQPELRLVDQQAEQSACSKTMFGKHEVDV